MSPQRSNRSSLIEGTLRCLERLPPEKVTARAIAAESGANVASIAYHFGSKDELVTEAVTTGLDRWLEEITSSLDRLTPADPPVRLGRAGEIFHATRTRHAGLAKNFLSALARAQHDPQIRELLTDGFRRTRPKIAALLELGRDQAGEDAGGLVHSLFVGLLFQELLDPGLAIDGERMREAQSRLRTVLPPGRSREQVDGDHGHRSTKANQVGIVDRRSAQRSHMIRTMILFGLVFGRWWRLSLLAAAVGWPILLISTGVMGFEVALLGAGGLAVLNTAAGVLVHQGLLWTVRRLRPAGPGQA
jgi:AcrR family transcriptional regulator